MAHRINTFRDLIAWQKGMELARCVYAATTALPRTEQFGLINQMRRAAVSIPSNIAEGYGRGSRADYVKFLRIARGSWAELFTQAELAWSLGLMPANAVLAGLIAEEERILQGLIMSLKCPDG